MIIIIGKEDRAKMLDIYAYVKQCGSHFVCGCSIDSKFGKKLKEDCDKLSDWILSKLHIR